MPKGIYKREKRIKPPYRCNVCKKLLTVLNWYETFKNNRLFVCKHCHDVRVRDWKYKNPEEIKKLIRNWSRKHNLTTWRNGKQIVLRGNKRNYPKTQKCELCNQKHKKLVYHHWDEKNISKGIWIDYKCHMFIETIDKFGKFLIKKYISLKKKINTEK